MRTSFTPWRAKASAAHFPRDRHDLSPNTKRCRGLLPSRRAPEIVIRPIAAALRSKVLCSPAFKPLRHALLHVLTIRIDVDPARLL